MDFDLSKCEGGPPKEEVVRVVSCKGRWYIFTMDRTYVAKRIPWYKRVWRRLFA